MMGVERFAISFKTAFNGNTHRHVVLGIYHSGRYGALGMSRREDLMYKPLVYRVSAVFLTEFIGMKNNPTLCMAKPTIWPCAQQRLRSARANAQADQGLCCALSG